MGWTGRTFLRIWSLSRNEDFERELDKGEVSVKTRTTVKVWSQLSRQHLGLDLICIFIYKYICLVSTYYKYSNEELKEQWICIIFTLYHTLCFM